MDDGHVRFGGEIVAFPISRPDTYWGQDVERINQYAFYDLGRALRALTGHVGDVPRAACLWDFFTARTTINRLLSGDPIPLGVSRHAAERVKTVIDDAFSYYYSTKKTDGTLEFRYPQDNDAPIHSFTFDNARQAIANFETVFSAEMTEATSYFVPRRGIYATTSSSRIGSREFPA